MTDTPKDIINVLIPPKVDFLLVGRVATSVTNNAKSSEVGVDTLPKFTIDLSAIWFPYEFCLLS